MRNVDEILEQARRLSIKERRELLERLEDVLAEDETREATPSKGPYAKSLALAGTVDSDFSDLSTDKYKHVAAASSPEAGKE